MNYLEMKLEEIDDSRFWQLIDVGLKNQLVLPRNRFG